MIKIFYLVYYASGQVNGRDKPLSILPPCIWNLSICGCYEIFCKMNFTRL